MANHVKDPSGKFKAHGAYKEVVKGSRSRIEEDERGNSQVFIVGDACGSKKKNKR